MKISITLLGAASGQFEKLREWLFENFILAGLVSLEEPATPRSRGHSFCIGCDAATNGQWPWQGRALRTIFRNGVKPPHQSPMD